MEGIGDESGRFSIGIDGYNLAMPSGTGIATYGRVLTQTLSAMDYSVTGVFGIDAGRDPNLRDVLFFEALGKSKIRNDADRRRFARHRNRVAANPFLRRAATDISLSGRVETATLPQLLPPFDRIANSTNLFEYAHRHFRYYGRMLPLSMRRPPSIMHWTYPVPIRMMGSKNIYSIHDLVPLKLPHTTLDGKRFYRKLLSACILHAEGICTVSEASRSDIIAEFAIDPSLVVNTYQCSPWVNEISKSELARSGVAVEGIFGLKPQQYFLFFGSIEPKKNLGRLIEAFLGSRLNVPLVLVGGRSWESERELSLLPQGEELETGRGRQIADRIIRIDHLARPLLLQLIHNARAVCFPSLYEGFGLPVLEAMQMGAPVLTSNVSAIPEIGGEAALYVDPYDTAAIGSAIRSLDEDESLRKRLTAAGLLQAERFTQANYAKRLQDMYRAALA